MHSAIVDEVQGGLNTSKIAYWSDLEVDALVDYLHTHYANETTVGISRTTYMLLLITLKTCALLERSKMSKVFKVGGFRYTIINPY